MMKLNLILKHVYVLIRSFLNHIAPKMIWLNILKNVTVCLVKYFVSHIVTHITRLQDKSKFILLHNFMKCFSCTRVNHIVIINIWMVNCPIFWICYFQLGKKWCLQNLYSKKEWSSTIIFSQLWQRQIIWYLFESFKTIILCSMKYVLPVKYGLRKLWLELWNMNHESLNWTLDKNKCFILYWENIGNA